MSGAEPIRSLDDPFDAPTGLGRRRLLGLGGAMGLGMASLTAQLWRLQVLSGPSFREQADNNRFRLRRVDPPRGVIYDRDEHPLARNRPSYVIAVVPADLPTPPEPVFRRLARLIGTSPAEIGEIVRVRAQDRFTPVPIRSWVDPKLAHRIEERHLELPGVHVIVQPVREYVDGQLFSHVIGYVGPVDSEEFARFKDDPERDYAIDDDIGKMGLELTREAELRGRPGQRRTEVDSAGRELRVLGTDPARPGSNLTLTLDSTLQREVTRVLAEELSRFEVASAVALDPRNGQVLAMVHLPAFDNNAFARELTAQEFAALVEDSRRPLVNGAIADTYPPGSIFKIVTAVAGLESGVITPNTRVDCPGALLLPDRMSPGGVARIPCWGVHGTQDCATALANSCNVYFYVVAGGHPRGEAEALEIERMADWARRLGMGEPTGLELPNEASGFVPTRSWKRRNYRQDWFTGDTYNVAIGQGYLTATPIQVAGLIGAIANGGRVMRPQVVLHRTDARGTTASSFQPHVVRDLGLDPDKLKVVQRGLRYGMGIGRTDNETSYTGTSWQWDLRDLAVAGKTGTAEWVSADGKSQTHGWFAGYAPFDAPQLALSLFVKRGSGAEDAARLARRIFAFYFGVSED